MLTIKGNSASRQQTIAVKFEPKTLMNLFFQCLLSPETLQILFDTLTISYSLMLPQLCILTLQPRSLNLFKNEGLKLTLGIINNFQIKISILILSFLGNKMSLYLIDPLSLSLLYMQNKIRNIYVNNLILVILS